MDPYNAGGLEALAVVAAAVVVAFAIAKVAADRRDR